MSDDASTAEALILTEDVDGVRTITLNRPEARNAFNRALYAAVGSALEAAEADDSVRVVILTGAGKGFSAGMDLKELATIDTTSDRVQAELIEHGFHALVGAMEGVSKPLIAAVHGAAVGSGTTMLPYCDLVIVADDARLRLPFVPLGLAPEGGSSYTVPAIFGPQRGAYYQLTGDWLDGPGAVGAGLALRCVPRDDLMKEAGALARRLAELPPAALAATKRLVRAGWHDLARAARLREEAQFTALLGGAASTDAVDQFVRGRGART